MKFSIATVASVVALVGSAIAQLEVISPSGDNLWWVAQSDNTLMWSCKSSPYSNFTVLITNSNPSILSAPLAIIAQQENYDCSETIAKTQINESPATGYTIQLADPFNNTNIYAQSQPFEIKALGAAYPPASATPSTDGSATSSASATSGSGSGSSSGSASQPTGSTTKNGAAGLSASICGVVAVAAALSFVMA